MANYGRISVQRKTGDEHFHSGGDDLPFDLRSFWQWAGSDIVSNVWRGLIAEYLVAQAVGIGEGARDEWAMYDIHTPDGLKIEVKSSAYLQSWYQEGPSSVGFDIGPKLGWDSASNTYEAEPRRSADLYVFALHSHSGDKATLDPLNVSQWEFYVLPTARLNEKCPTQKKIKLRSLLSKFELQPVSFDQLRKAIEDASTQALVGRT